MLSDETGLVYLIVSNCCSLLVGIMLAGFSYFLGKKQANINYKREKEQHEKELNILLAQLEEQKRQNELNEKAYQEQNQPKMHLTKWDYKK